jgi:Undecaprenyl-phosphate galactose phosphotransferase WbaP
MKKKIFSFIVLLISDLAVVFISFWLAYLIRSEILPHLFYKFKIAPIPLSNFLNYYYMVFFWTAIFAYERLYTKRYPYWEEVRVLLKSATLTSFFIMIMIFVTRKQIQLSRAIVILAWLLSLFLFPLFRYLIKIFLVKINLWKKKLIILGANETSLLALKSINQNKTMGYEILGFLDDNPQRMEKKVDETKILGPISELQNIAKTYKFKDIMIAIPNLPRKKLNQLLSICENISESIWLIPNIGELVTTGVEIETLGQVLTLNIRKNLAKPWNIFIKSLFEKILTLISIILLLPILVLIAITIKLDSKGSIIFVQKRIGQNKKMFPLFKFRSMYFDSDKKLIEYINKNQKARIEWETYKKLRNYDPRVTRIGRIIRRYSLDELPQLFNVMLGKMSLVGPRPYLFEELKGKVLFKDTIAKVKPGITGLWQISGRSELPFEERLALDEYYIRNWSLWMDIIILLKSIKVLFSKKGAY